MTYRKINVEGTEYRYTVGTKVTKVQQISNKDFTLHRNSDIGHLIHGEIKNGEQMYSITPHDVRNAILGNPVAPRTCSAHGFTTTELAYNPYESELYNRYQLMINCRECVANVAADI